MSHQKPITAAEFLSGIQPGSIYIAAIGSYSPDPNKVNRYTLYREQGDGIEWCADAWLEVAEAEKLAAVPNLRIGESDAMYSVDPRLVWYRHSDTIKIFSEEKRIFSLTGEAVQLHGKELTRTDIRSVHVYLARGWVECGVRLVLTGEEVLIALQENEVASYDITYDGFNLMADTWWAVALGRLLSEALGCPYEADEDLR